MYFPELKTAIALQVNTSVFRAIPEPPVRLVTELAEIIRAYEKREDKAADSKAS